MRTRHRPNSREREHETKIRHTTESKERWWWHHLRCSHRRENLEKSFQRPGSERKAQQRIHRSNSTRSNCGSSKFPSEVPEAGPYKRPTTRDQDRAQRVHSEKGDTLRTSIRSQQYHSHSQNVRPSKRGKGRREAEWQSHGIKETIRCDTCSSSSTMLSIILTSVLHMERSSLAAKFLKNKNTTFVSSS